MKRVLFSILGIFLIMGITGCDNNNDFIEFEHYQQLNPQELHNDFVDNEISAKDKYKDNYYYFSGTIYNIEEFLNDNYLEIRYVSEKDNSKIIELDAYFPYGSEELKTLKKDDNVTVYCKFKQRSIENYENTVTSYSFKSCRLK